MQTNYYHDFSQQLLKLLQCSELLPSLANIRYNSLSNHPLAKADVLSFSRVAPLYTCHLESFALVAIQLFNHFARF